MGLTKSVGFSCLYAIFIAFSISAYAQNISKKETVSLDERASAQKDSNQTDTKPTADYRLRRGDKDFSVEYGISPFNPSNFAGPKEFDVYGRDLHLVTFRFGRVIGTKKNVSYQYMFGVTPLAVFTKNEVVNPEYVSPTATPTIAPTKRETTYGLGFQPVNFKFIFLAKNRLKPYAQVGAGILVTNKAVPVSRSTLFQLTGDFGGGLMYMLSPNKAVSLGYKYFHISNGNINGKINNPGFNANVFYLNYSFFWNRK
ncbi:MAG TPA: acyloxyacyl hydrolase [Pyrinomonadaceae bacterium]|jgi:opacity protein-like surface antigen